MADKLPDWAKVGAKVIVTDSWSPGLTIEEIVRTTATSAWTKNKHGHEQRWVASRWSRDGELDRHGGRDSWRISHAVQVDSKQGKAMIRDAQWQDRRREVDAAIGQWNKDPTVANTDKLRGLLEHWAVSKQAEEARDGTGQDV